MVFNFLHEDGPCRAGIDFTSLFILRLGVGLLGAGVLAGLIALTIATGFVAGALFGRPWRFALLTGGAVAICGASAAAAIAAILPANDQNEKNTLFTVIAVTALSTIAMVVYPLLFQTVGFTDIQTGFLIGATIHEVVQVVGAGFQISDTAGEMATITKLFRVAMLPVVLLLIILALRIMATGTGRGKIPTLPWFMFLFLALVGLGSAADLPQTLVMQVDAISRGFLIMAIVALGVKTSLKALTTLGSGHLAMVVVETLALLGFAMMAIVWLDLL